MLLLFLLLLAFHNILLPISYKNTLYPTSRAIRHYHYSAFLTHLSNIYQSQILWGKHNPRPVAIFRSLELFLIYHGNNNESSSDLSHGSPSAHKPSPGLKPGPQLLPIPSPPPRAPAVHLGLHGPRGHRRRAPV